MSWKRFTTLIVSVLILLLLVKLVQACSGDEDPYDAYTSFFPNTVVQKPAYTPFFYADMIQYYDQWYDYQPDEIIPDANIAAWKDYTGNAVPEADLDSFIYKYSREPLSNLYYHLEKGTALSLPGEVSGNAFTKWFEGSRDLEALGYLMYAKQCEPFVSSSAEWEPPHTDTAKMSRLIKSGLQLQKAAQKDFFKDRYTYQVLRLSLYAGKPRQTLELYGSLIGDKQPAGLIPLRSLGLKAGALFRLKRKVEAAYLYSRVFDGSDGEKRKAYLSFNWAVGKDVAPVLKLCTNAHERAVVYVMDGLHEYEDGLPAMQAAYAADPAVDGLDVLMTREINKAEERFLHPQLMAQRNIQGYDTYDSRYHTASEDSTHTAELNKAVNKYTPYLQSLNAFAQKAASDGKGGRRAFWLLSSAYICLMEGDAASCSKNLDLAAASSMNTREGDLHDLIRTLYIVRSADRITPQVEAALLPALKSMDERAIREKGYGKAYRDLMGNVLTTAYMKGGDTVKAIYTLARVTRDEHGKFYVSEDFIDLPGGLLEYISIEKLQEVKAFVQRPDKTPYERWLLDSTPYSADVLMELEGTKHLREHRFDKAIEVLQKVSPEVLERRSLPDPFVAHMKDMQDLDAADTAKWYTKLSYARRMQELKAKTEQNPGDADALFDYAVGLYSMSYYGKAHGAFTYYRSSTDGLAYFNSPDRKAMPAYVQEYYGAMEAEQYFVRAAAKTAVPEFRAKCIFMAAKCWQKRIPSARSFREYEDGETYRHASYLNPYFRELKDKSGATGFFTRATGTCSYLADYVRGRK